MLSKFFVGAVVAVPLIAGCGAGPSGDPLDPEQGPEAVPSASPAARENNPKGGTPSSDDPHGAFDSHRTAQMNNDPHGAFDSDLTPQMNNDPHGLFSSQPQKPSGDAGK